MRVIDTAIKYGVDPRTVYNWIKMGCPCSYEQKKPLGKPVGNLNPEEVDAWLAARNAARVAKVPAPKPATPAPPAKVEKVPAKVPAPAPASEPAGVMGAPAAAAPAAGVDSVIQYLAGRVEITLTGLALHECAAAFMAEMEGCGWCGSDGRPVVDWKPHARAFALRWQKGGVA